MRQTRGLLIACLLLMPTAKAWALELGEPVPRFVRSELQSQQTTDLASFRGQVVYLDFWASWCGPCRVSLPTMERLYRELSPRGFQVIAVNVDQDIDEAHRFLEKHPVSYPVLKDDGRLPKLFDVRGMPTAFLLDRQGRLRLVHQGFRSGDEQQLREQIIALIKETHTKGEQSL